MKLLDWYLVGLAVVNVFLTFHSKIPVLHLLITFVCVTTVLVDVYMSRRARR